MLTKAEKFSSRKKLTEKRNNFLRSRVKREKPGKELNVPLDQELLGQTGRHSITYEPAHKRFHVRFNGETVFTGTITANPRGIDTLELQKHGGPDDKRTAHGYLDGSFLVIHGYNILVQVNPFHHALTRLQDARLAASAARKELEESLEARAKESIIIGKLQYQLTSGCILHHPPSKQFILATQNLLGASPTQWEFFEGRITHGKDQSFIRFSEMLEWGHSSLLASAYLQGKKLLIEFEYQQPVQTTLSNPQADYLAPLRRKAHPHPYKMRNVSNVAEPEPFHDDEEDELTEEDLARLRGEMPIEQARPRY